MQALKTENASQKYNYLFLVYNKVTLPGDCHATLAMT